MNPTQAAALIRYLQRAHPIIPTTGAEYSLMSGAISTIEGVASGLVTIDVKPVEAAPGTSKTD